MEPVSKAPVAIPAPEQAQSTEVKNAPPTEQDPATRERWAQLARKEKAIRAEARKVQEERAAIEQARSQAPDWKQRAAKDPLGLLAEAGVDYNQLAQLLLQDPKEFQLRQLQQEIEALKNGTNDMKSQAEKARTQQYDAAIKQLRREASLLVDGSDAYKAIKLEGDDAKDAIVSLIEETYKSDGTILSAKEAADQVEAYLGEKAKKYASLYAPPVQEQASEQPALQKQPAQPIKTLSNDMSSSLTRSLTSKERRERAILAMKGQLK